MCDEPQMEIVVVARFGRSFVYTVLLGLY